MHRNLKERQRRLIVRIRKIHIKHPIKLRLKDFFEENTTYYYSYTDDVKNPNWSEVQSYTTKKTTNFQTILVGDLQIGASGSQGQGTADDINIAVDTLTGIKLWNRQRSQHQMQALFCRQETRLTMQEQTVQMERMSEKANMQDLLIRHF